MSNVSNVSHLVNEKMVSVWMRVQIQKRCKGNCWKFDWCVKHDRICENLQNKLADEIANSKPKNQ